MAHYTATVRSDGLLELPRSARERLTPGQLVDINLPDGDDTGTADPTVTWLVARIASAPTDEAEIRDAEEDLLQLMRNMNANRSATGERVRIPGRSMIVFLDSGPLAVLTNAKTTPQTVAILKWATAMRKAGHTFVVPAMADYEVRRELERSGKTNGLAVLDSWNSGTPGRFLPVTTSA